MNQRAFLQGMDAAIADAFLDMGMADAAQYQAAGVDVPCRVLVDRAAQFFEDTGDIVGRRTVVTIFLAEVPAPMRGALLRLASGDVLRLDARVEADESMQKWVVTHG
ncbi:hypothetical protein CO615_00030 [Lysobacteraceae bacterium NML75-0749]|nr:hypothetical protein CO615_00030 [Xanthomonadaceae bacterium NML75-0749]